MSTDTGFEDYSLLDMFRSEVETHSDVLSTALLALERAPNDTSRIEEMMRAAHSIKGASRVVGVDLAVTLAHIMEDCFVAAQSGSIALSPADIDVLLRGVDLLNKIAASTREPTVDLAQEFDGPVEQLASELRTVLAGDTRAAPGPAEASITAADATADSASAGHDRSARSTPTMTSLTITCPKLLDGAAAEVVRRQFLSAIDARPSTIELDLHATRDLDVQGLAILAAMPRHLATHGSLSLELAGISDAMQTVLRVTGLARLYVVRPSSREAR